jgi:hypothetical protein
MAMKFFKSLLVLMPKHKEILHGMVRLDPIKKCLPVVESCKTKLKTLNMLHSAMFEFINSFGSVVYELIGEDLHETMV